MAWRLRAGVSLHPMPFGGAFVVDDVRLAARQISPELTCLLTGAAPPRADSSHGAPPPAVPPAVPPAAPPTPALAAELRLGIDDGWLIHQEEYP